MAFRVACSNVKSLRSAWCCIGWLTHRDLMGSLVILIVTLATDKSLHGKKVLAQNLAGDKTIDISSLVQVRGKCLFIPHQHGAGEEWQPPAEGEELLVGEPA